MKLQTSLCVLPICFLCFLVTACNRSKTVAAPDPTGFIIQGLESSVGWSQLDALEAVKQTTDPDVLARLQSKVEALAVSPSAQTIVTSKAGTVLYQKYGQADPRHAVAYTHLLLDDPTMADALRKSATLDKKATLQALEAKEKLVLEISPDLKSPSDQEAAKKLLAELQALKNEIGK